MVAHPCNPSTWEAEAGDWCEFETSLGYKSELKASLNCIAKPCLKNKTKQTETNLGRKPKSTFSATSSSCWSLPYAPLPSVCLITTDSWQEHLCLML